MVHRANALFDTFWPREAEILAWVARGRTNPEIAIGLFLAPGTVKKHLDNIYRKLSVRTRTEAAFLALSSGWAAAPGIESRSSGIWLARLLD